MALNTIFNLDRGEENREKVLLNVKKSISFIGSNLWILACAILIASVGLNVNSTAVIIGAMLISPLMGPIVGAGFALGIYDFNLLRRSLSNLLLSTIVGLVVSTLYFWLTPFKEAQSEILARTAPNIYDVLIAFFGGLVGVIAITRVEKGNPIPGVAIATALMPPLCTAGFALANGKWDFFAGAMYLYAINCTFIGIATYLIVKLLKYPPVKIVDKKEANTVKWGIWLIIMATTIPSIFLAFKLFKEQDYRFAIDRFIRSNFEDKGYTIIYQRTNLNSKPRTLELAFLTHKFTQPEIDTLNINLKKNLPNTQLIIRQDSAFLAGSSIKDAAENEAADKSKIALQELTKELKEKELQSAGIFNEARAIFPELTSLAVSNQDFVKVDTVVTQPIVIYQSEKDLPKDQKERFNAWLKVKLKKDSVELYHKPMQTSTRK